MCYQQVVVDVDEFAVVHSAWRNRRYRQLYFLPRETVAGLDGALRDVGHNIFRLSRVHQRFELRDLKENIRQTKKFFLYCLGVSIKCLI